jgi:hypothetical protein
VATYAATPPNQPQQCILTDYLFGGVATYAATPPNQPQQCILTDYFNNYNFSKLK